MGGTPGYAMGRDWGHPVMQWEGIGVTRLCNGKGLGSPGYASASPLGSRSPFIMADEVWDYNMPVAIGEKVQLISSTHTWIDGASLVVDT